MIFFQYIKTYINRVRYPKTLFDAFALTILAQRVFGMFPYYLNETTSKIKISLLHMLVTFVHFFIFVSLILNINYMDYKTFAEPIISNLNAAIFGQLIIKNIDIIITLSIFLKLFVKIYHTELLLKKYFVILKCAEKMSLNANGFMRKLVIFSICESLLCFVLCGLHIAGNVYYFIKLTNEQPSYYHCFLLIYSDLYKLMFLFILITNFFYINFFANQMNKQLLKILETLSNARPSIQ